MDEEEKVIIKDYIITEQGFRVWKCCASCALCKPDNNGLRLCTRTNKRTRPSAVCDGYIMRPKLNQLGTGETQEPKTKEYLDYVLTRRLTEDQLIAQGEMKKDQRASIFDLRTDWQAGTHQSIYIEL